MRQCIARAVNCKSGFSEFPAFRRRLGKTRKLLRCSRRGLAAPDFVAGVLQVNVTIPAGVTGTVPIQLNIGTASISSTVTIH